METGVKWSGFFVLQVYKGNRGELGGGAIWSMQPQKMVFVSRCVCDLIWNMQRGWEVAYKTQIREGGFCSFVGGGLKGMPSFLRCEYPCISFLVI